MNIEDIWKEYHSLHTAENGITEEAKGKACAYAQVMRDCNSLSIMQQSKASKRKQQAFLQGIIDCYNAAYPLGDAFSVAARTVLLGSVEKWEQIKKRDPSTLRGRR